ncbi:hypothetical protein RJ641_015754 [Dillenia turbinata]|uniref:Replication factor C subunit 3 n=1 Tax=Dillenia turbinata TaxID=194707 RepID=A0AAN8UQJ9_9MAGN
MPSPTIPRTSSDPNFITSSRSGCQRSLSKRSSYSTRSSCSTCSSKTTWPKKVGRFIGGRNNLLSNHSDLTEESLEEFNRRYGSELDRRYIDPSPYYKGLTDSSLVLGRHRTHTATSPGRESQATTNGSTSSYSSFVARIQKLGAFLGLKTREHSKGYSKHHEEIRYQCAAPRESLVSVVKESGHERSRSASLIESVDISSKTIIKQKPLGERVTKDSSSLATSMQEKMSLAKNENNNDNTINKNNERDFVWADKYGPTALKDFICHHGKAIQLQSLVDMGDCTHIIFEGPPGVGKRTMIRALLREVFGPDKIKVQALSSLSASWKTLVVTVSNSAPNGKLTLGMLEDSLFNEEQEKKDKKSKNIPDESNAAMVGSDEGIESLIIDTGAVYHYVPKGSYLQLIKNVNLVSPRWGITLSQIVRIGDIVVETSTGCTLTQRDARYILDIMMLGYEKHVIVELVKERHTRISDKAVQCNHHNCRVIILYDADKLSTDALLYIKWLLERYKGCNKVLFCSNDASKIHAIKTLCTVIQLLPPPNHEIVQFLEFIAEKEGIELPREVAEKIADKSQNNLRQAVRSFEASWKSNNFFTRDQMIRTGWEEVIANIAKNIIQEQSPKQLYLIRGKLQTLIEHDVSPAFIADTLYAELKIHLKEQFQPQFVDLYKEFSGDEGRMLDSAKTFFLAPTRREEQGKRINDPLKKNSYHFMRIEEFIAKFMSWYKVTVLNKRTIPQRVEA